MYYAKVRIAVHYPFSATSLSSSRALSTLVNTVRGPHCLTFLHNNGRKADFSMLFNGVHGSHSVGP